MKSAASGSRRPLRLRRLGLALAAIGVALGIAEVAARVFWSDHVPGQVPGMFVADVAVGYRMAANFHGVQDADGLRVEIATNELGYRNRPLASKQPGQHRILVLGDSMAFGHLVAADQAFPAVLEQQMRNAGRAVEVVNAAAPGYATCHEFQLLAADADRVQPDEVILAFYVGNDFAGNHTQRFGVLAAEWGGLVNHSLHPDAWERVGNLLFAHSRLAVLLRQALRPRATPIGDQAIRYVCNQADWDSGFGIAMIRRQWSEDAQEAFRQSQSWLRIVADFCQERRLPLRVVLVPGPLQYCDAMWQQAVSLCGFAPAEFERDKPDRLLVEWCEAQHIQVLDLLPAFTAASRERPDRRLFLDVHLSPAGHQIAAAAIATTWYP